MYNNIYIYNIYIYIYIYINKFTIVRFLTKWDFQVSVSENC